MLMEFHAIQQTIYPFNLNISKDGLFTFLIEVFFNKKVPFSKHASIHCPKVYRGRFCEIIL